MLHIAYLICVFSEADEMSASHATHTRAQLEAGGGPQPSGHSGGQLDMESDTGMVVSVCVCVYVAH